MRTLYTWDADEIDAPIVTAHPETGHVSLHQSRIRTDAFCLTFNHTHVEIVRTLLREIERMEEEQPEAEEAKE